MNIWINIMFLLESSYMNHLSLCLSLFFQILGEKMNDVVFLKLTYILGKKKLSLLYMFHVFSSITIVLEILPLIYICSTRHEEILLLWHFIFYFLSIIFWVMTLQIFIFPMQINFRMMWTIIINYQFYFL